MNRYAVQDLTIRQAQAGRREEARQLTASEQRALELSARAREVIRERLPEFVGRGEPVCSWAVWALLDLWRRHGEGNVSAAQIRALREERVARLVDGLGFDPWHEERAA